MKQYQASYRFEMISYRFYSEFRDVDKSVFLKGLNIPDYLPFTKNII